MTAPERSPVEAPNAALDEDSPWSGFDLAVLGGGLLPEVQDLLARAGACRNDV
jgi:hypothetical protein